LPFLRRVMLQHAQSYEVQLVPAVRAYDVPAQQTATGTLLLRA